MAVEPGRKYVVSNQRLDIIFADDLGTRTDPVSVKFKAKNESCGSQASYTYGVNPEIHRVGLGEYIASFVPMTAGRWHFRLEAVDMFGLPFAREGNFVVQASPFFDHSEPGYSS